MGKGWPQATIMITGALLILLGVVAVGVQIFSEFGGASIVPQQSQQMHASTTDFQVTTRFPGIELVIIGAVLEIVGYLGTRPWSGIPK
jgi:hypothetical protein